MADRQTLPPVPPCPDGPVPGSRGFCSYIPTGQEPSGRALTFRSDTPSAAVTTRARLLAFSGADGPGGASVVVDADRAVPGGDLGGLRQATCERLRRSRDAQGAEVGCFLYLVRTLSAPGRRPGSMSQPHEGCGPCSPGWGHQSWLDLTC